MRRDRFRQEAPVAVENQGNSGFKIKKESKGLPSILFYSLSVKKYHSVKVSVIILFQKRIHIDFRLRNRKMAIIF